MSSKKVAVVTGSNKGIGFTLVKHLCLQFEGDVVLCSRDEGRGKDALDKFKSQGLNPILQIVDIENADTLSQLRDFLVKNYGGLDLLVNNAAIFVASASSYENAKKTMDTNYFGTARACDILFPILRPGARVVNISSMAGCLNWITSDDLKTKLLSPLLTRKEVDELANLFLQHVKEGVDKDNGWPMPSIELTRTGNSYYVSKILINALTFLQQREFDKQPEKDIVVNAVHPGFVQTDMTQNQGLYTTEDSMIPILSACFVPPKGELRGKFIWEDATLCDWNRPLKELIDISVERYKTPPALYSNYSLDD